VLVCFDVRNENGIETKYAKVPNAKITQLSLMKMATERLEAINIMVALFLENLKEKLLKEKVGTLETINADTIKVQHRTGMM